MTVNVCLDIDILIPMSHSSALISSQMLDEVVVTHLQAVSNMWKKALIKPIPKNESKYSNPRLYRGKNLTSNVGKL